MSLPSVIMRAMSQGFNMKQVIDWLLKNNKSMGKNIQRALKQGYTHDQIGEYLTKGEHATYSQREQMLSGITEKERADRIAQGTPGDWKKPLSTAIGIGGAALGAYGLARNIPGAIGVVRGLFGRNTSPNIGPQPMANAPVQPPAIAPVGGVNPANIPQIPPQVQTLPGIGGQGSTNLTQNAGQQQSSQQPPVDSRSILRQMELEPKINNLLKAGNTPDVIGGALDKMLTPVQKKWLDSQIKEGKAKSLPEMVADYAQSEPITEKKAEPEEKVKPLDFSKGSIVATPHGTVGELETSRNGQALVKDESGKLHNFKQEDLIPSPLPKKELADLHNELISGIEEETGEDVSRMVNWSGYNPETNTLAFLPHIGALYTYSNIDPEDVALLTSVLSTRKTSGGNFIGAWKQGSKSPIGAAMSALIKKLQAERGGKGNEYEEKFETIYDAMEPAKLAAKKKKAEEDKRKRKEKR